MSNQYFLKDKKATFYKKVLSDKTDGNFVREYEKYYPCTNAPVWVFTKQLSQSDIFGAAAYGIAESRMFVTSFKPYLELYDLILYRGEWFRITRIDPPEDYQTDMFIYVENAKGGWVPQKEDVMPYDADKIKLNNYYKDNTID